MEQAFGRAFLEGARARSVGEPMDVLVAQGVQVGVVLDQSLVHQQAHVLFPERFDVHRFARGEMLDASFYLRGAMVFVGAVMVGFALGAHQRRPASRAKADVLRGACIGRTAGEVHSDDLGDDLPTLFHQHRITDAQVQFFDLVGVVQRGPLDGGAGQ